MESTGDPSFMAKVQPWRVVSTNWQSVATPHPSGRKLGDRQNDGAEKERATMVPWFVGGILLLAAILLMVRTWRNR
jgi:hypothetical protein